MQKRSARVDAGPPIDSSANETHEPDDSGFRPLLGQKSMMLFCAWIKLASEINPYGSLELRLRRHVGRDFSSEATRGSSKTRAPA